MYIHKVYTCPCPFLHRVYTCGEVLGCPAANPIRKFFCSDLSKSECPSIFPIFFRYTRKKLTQKLSEVCTNIILCQP